MIPAGVEGLLAVAMLAELRRQLGPQSDDFLIAVGQQIGAACTPVEDADTESLVAWMNDLWEQLGLGRTSLTPGPRRLEIRHQLPTLAPDAVLWRDALPCVIEGVYRGWFQRLDPRGVVTRAGASESDLKFVYSD
jgi:hypothetical protein